MAVSPELALTRQVERKALDDSSEHSIPPGELVRLAEHLKRLHRLSASSYESLDLAFEDHLKTGGLLFGLPVGVILEIERDHAVIRTARGTTELRAGSSFPLLAATSDSASLAPNLGLKTPIAST